MVTRLPAVQGFITSDNSGDQGRTPLEIGLRYATLEWVESGLLRQYAWVTYLAYPALEMVGGAEELRQSGAFADVREVAGRGVVAVATDRASEYGKATMREVWQAVAPALPAGDPGPASPFAADTELVYEDAAPRGATTLDC